METECRNVCPSGDKSDKQRLWISLLEAGLIDIPAADVPDRIKEAKAVVMARLGELLQLKSNIQERESAAHSLATLKKLETTLSRTAK
jgi:hypothetical protein